MRVLLKDYHFPPISKEEREEASLKWHPSAKRYLLRLGLAEYNSQLLAWTKKRRKKSTFRYCPTQYHIDLIQCLNNDTEEKFKAIKMEQGYASSLHV